VTASEKAGPDDKVAQVTLRISRTDSRYKRPSYASRQRIPDRRDRLYGKMVSMNYEQNKQNRSACPQRKVERS
jgi:hypothetical protein